MKLRTQKLELRRTLSFLCALLSSKFSVLSSAQQPKEPIIVNIKETESEIDGLADVFIGSLGLAGILLLGAIVAAVVFAGLLFWIRSRAD